MPQLATADITQVSADVAATPFKIPKMIVSDLTRPHAVHGSNALREVFTIETVFLHTQIQRLTRQTKRCSRLADPSAMFA